MRTSTVVLLLLSALLISAQKSHAKGTPELMQPLVYETDNSEMLAKVSSELLNALANIESMQEGTPIKIAEKRRNKFEFIRFGRK
ncbi:FMRFamide peptide FLP-12 [Trichostrongylus colubriformis]|uniref:FMRFamide peptide FLP-12 n=1 Tax=Trichostrongylus colubriformis TaxID=6319 RepID=A0AAN8IG34_TRICO